jgi:hypothetical protein
MNDKETSGWDDWRIRNQAKYLKAEILKWAKWKTPKPDWDHDHCEFCSQKFSDNPGHTNAVKYGYTTADKYYWICKKCFSDFKKLFEWKVKK